MKDLTLFQKNVCRLIGGILGILLFCWITGCSKKANVTPTVGYGTATFTVWSNHLEAGEKIYIFYKCGKQSFEDSTTALLWKQTDTGRGIASIRALIRKPGTQIFITPTNDTLYGDMVEKGNVLSYGYVTQNTYLDLNFSNTY